MKTLMLLHGPNLNWLGKRNQLLYGTCTLSDIETRVAQAASQYQYAILAYQSNHEGALIDYLQAKSGDCEGIIINPGALAHYSYALHDALLDTRLPIIEVHLSLLSQRESWRQQSVISPACRAVIMGRQIAGYDEAVDKMVSYLYPGI